MTSFNFITNEDFRTSLEADYHEMTKCLEAKAWKAVHVLAGSIIEALLIDTIIAEGIIPRNEALKIDFGKAIHICKDKNVISLRTADLCSVIKDYRNLIHPGRIIRLEESVDQDSANVASSLVSMVLTDVEKRKRENYGYTAEQIASKIWSDSSSRAIIPHLLKMTNSIELERLLFKILPDNYMNTSNEIAYIPDHVAPTLIMCFRKGFDQASEELKVRISKWFVKLFKEESDVVIDSYGVAFLRFSDLCHLSVDEADLVKQHLLEHLNKNVDEIILDTLDGIGEYLDKGDATKFVDPLVKAICQKSNLQLSKKAKKVYEKETVNTSTEVDEKIYKRLDLWISAYNENGEEDNAKKVSDLKAVTGIPF